MIRYRYLLFIGLLSFSCLFVNHFLVPWEKLLQKEIESSFINIVNSQRNDLEFWVESSQNGNKNFSKYTYCDKLLDRWSSNEVSDFRVSNDSIQVYRSNSGILLSQTISKDDCLYISIYPLVRNYEITNSFLKGGKNRLVHGSINDLSLNDSKYGFQGLFFYNFNVQVSSTIDAACLAVVFILVIWLYLQVTLKSSVRKLIVCAAILAGFRIITILLQVDSLILYPAFDPVHYTSNWLNPSLGSLVINVIIFFTIIISFLPRINKFSSIVFAKRLLLLVSLFLVLMIYFIIWDVLRNSQTSLDIGDGIDFYGKRSWFYLSIILLSALYASFSFFYMRILSPRDFREAIGLTTLICGVSFFFNPIIGIVFLVHMIVLLLGHKGFWTFNLEKFSYGHLLYLLFISLAMGFYAAFVVYKHHEKSELIAKRKFANHILLKRDVIGEYYFDQAVKKILQDSSLQLIASERSKSYLENEISKQLLGPYFNKYDLNIIFQNFQRLSISSEFAKENAALTLGNKTAYENIYFVDEGANFKYVCKIKIGDLIGLVILKIKRRVPNTVFPALLKDAKYFSISDDFDYAVFLGENILYHRSKFGQGEWPREADFNSRKLYEKGLEKNARHYLGIKTSDGRTILIISNVYSWKRFLTNASFWFLLIILSLCFCVFVRAALRKSLIIGFTGKIQLYIGFAFVLPLVAAAAALLPSLTSSYRAEIDRNYLKQALFVSDMLVDNLEENNELLLNKQLSEISVYIQNDLSIYDRNGQLIATSQPDIFNLSLQSELINPIVFEELIEKENQSVIVNESISELDYKVCYATVQGGAQQTIGFIALPFFDSKNHLRRQQVEVFGNLILIFGLIFMIAIVLGQYVMKNLLFPLRMVADKIRRVTLQEVNNPIAYQSNDEIGSLVADFNQMVAKLEQSKFALVRSQKETAWKEIARQVAHEIKNPLTPMQLKIQQLLRRKEAGTKEYETLNSLLQQIDTLSQIAESFSGFAEMPAPNYERINLSALAEEVGRLYKTEDILLDLAIAEGVFINADLDIFRGILNNIVLNGIQSVKNQKPILKIGLIEKDEKCILSVSDNGTGVPDEIKDKIFINYFSTKPTGSGIGLALAKKGIENAGGNIWFDSSDRGTTFYVSMPLDHS